MCKERASDESGGFEDDPERIRQELLPGPAPPPKDHATALQTIDDWNETWVSICDTQDTNRIVLTEELREFIEETKYLARWCESAGLDSSPLLEYAHNAWDTYYGFRPTLPHIPDALWVLLERLKYRLHPFQLRPFAEQTSATDEEHRQPIPTDEANIAVRKFLEQHPHATARQVVQGVGIAPGRVSKLDSWRAVQGRRKANKTPAPKRERKLTRKMLETLGRTNDPALRIEVKEAVWQRLLEEAEPQERAKLHSMKAEDRDRLIQAALEQRQEQLEE